jgi:hypothetical protein
VKQLAAAGENRACVDCDGTPYLGGLRCWWCFVRRCDENMGEHRVDQPISAAAYTAGCRCRGCRAASAEARRHYRRRAKAAA